MLSPILMSQDLFLSTFSWFSLMSDLFFVFSQLCLLSGQSRLFIAPKSASCCVCIACRGLKAYVTLVKWIHFVLCLQQSGEQQDSARNSQSIAKQLLLLQSSTVGYYMDCISSRQESIEAGVESRFLISEIRYARFVILFALCKDTLTNEPLLQSFQKQQSKKTFTNLSILFFFLTTFQLLSLVCNRIFFSPHLLMHVRAFLFYQMLESALVITFSCLNEAKFGILYGLEEYKLGVRQRTVVAGQ